MSPSHPLLFWIFIMLLGVGCSTTERRATSNRRPTVAIPERIKADERTYSRIERSPRQEKKHTAESRDKANIARCLKAINRITVSLRQLRRYHTESPPSSSPLSRMATLRPRSCRAKSIGRVMDLIHQAANVHRKKVGVIVPLTGPYQDLGKAIIDGIKAAAKRRGLMFHKLFIVRDSEASPSKALASLGELVYNHQVSMILGGVTEGEARALLPFAQGLLLPTVVMNKNVDLIGDNYYGFQVFPADIHMASSLAFAARHRNFRSIAILSPSSGKSDRLVGAFAEKAKSLGIHIEKIVKYTAEDFESMELAVKDISGTSIGDRLEEYTALYKAARDKAQQLGQRFNPKLVVLPPQLRVDAIMIPDNFRMVRHFVKLFKYHGVDELPLIGNHEWRSSGLIVPWDPFLADAMFVDYLGPYDHLPAGVRPPALLSPNFAQSSEAVQIDYRLVGYRAGLISTAVMSNASSKRFMIARQLYALRGDDTYFSKARVFSKARIGWWPTVVFSLSRKGLHVLGTANAPRANL